MKILLLKTMRDLRASLAQSMALIVIVMLGVASYGASVAAYRDLGTSYQRTYDQLKLADVTFTVQAAPESAANDLRKIEGVQAVAARLVVDTGMEWTQANGQTQEPIRARLISIPVGQHPEVDDVLLLKGKYPDTASGASVLLESHFSNYYHLIPGDTITPILNGQPTNFKIIGVVASPEYLVVSPSKQEILPSVRSFGVLFVPQSELQSQLGLVGTVNNFAVLLQPGANRTDVVNAAQALLAPYGLTDTTLQEDQPSNAALSADLGGFREIAYLMPLVILLVAAASVYLMLGRLVRAQTQQIGLMKAIGYTNRSVLWHYLLFALVIGVLGALLGALLGLPLGYAITKSYATELGIPIVASHFYPDLILEGVLLSLIATILAAIGPARGALRQSPAQAMRLDPANAQVKGRISVFERILHLPLWLRLPLRNVLRVRRRSLTTAMGIVFAYVLFLMVWGLTDSINYFFSNNYTVVEKWDVMALFDKPQSEAILSEIQNWQGVIKLEAIEQLPATPKANGHSEDILLTALDVSQTMHGFQLPAGDSAESILSEGQLILTNGMFNKLGLHQGDQVTLETPFGQQDFSLGPPSEEMMSAVGYISLTELQKRANSPQPIFNGVYLTINNIQAQQIKQELYQLPGAVSVQRKADLVADVQSYMILFYGIMAVMMVFALLMAFALLFNAMTISVLERKREFATMRTLGTGQRRIVLLLFVENLILWMFTLIPGLLLGYLTARGIGSSFNTDLFTFKIVIAPVSYVIAIAGILFTMLLATLPAIHRVNHLDLAEATKVLT
ncbi:MAG: FtsX-like permease family protein [Anaerolineales bacterium]